MTKPTIFIPLSPVPKPRMTRSDKWKQRPSVMRYWEYKDQLNLLVRGNLDARFTVVFKVAMPQSWSATRKLEFDGKPHQAKPDVDNFTKAFMDALAVDDSYIYDVHAQKYWAVEGSIILTERGN